MLENTNEEKGLIEQNLEFLGLDLDDIPKFLSANKDIRNVISKENIDRDYKVYKTLSIDKIQIRLTMLDRLSSLNEKMAESSNISEYLLKEIQDEKDLMRQSLFLKMLSELSIGDINFEEEMQDSLRESKPFRVKYKENFEWQIYYSKFNDAYFMLIPCQNFNTSKMFYLLREQIKYSKIKEECVKTIYVPICGLDYSEELLKISQIADLENYLNSLTKNLPNIYEVFDENGIVNIHILGETYIYDGIKTTYRVSLETSEKANEFYKILKAIFILTTEFKQDYNFRVEIDKDSNLKIYNNNIEMTYEYLPIFLREEYKKIEGLLKDHTSEIKEKKAKLEELKKVVFAKEKEHFYKQKQVSTYLEYKKTFMGKVRYYYKSKKNKFPNPTCDGAEAALVVARAGRRPATTG